MTDETEIPFPLARAEFRARQVAAAPDGRAYVVPSGMHERLRRVVASQHTDRDPKVALALAGWTCLQTDGMTDRINVDAPDDCAAVEAIREFARAHDAGSVAVAYHPSGEVVRSSDLATFAFDD